jgi:uncharacterized protein YcfJ
MRHMLMERCMSKPLDFKKAGLAIAMAACAGQASAEIVFYERPNFNGRTMSAERDVVNLKRWGFNDRATSAEVRGERWEVCEDAHFEGRCVVLRRGSYPSLAAMGLNNDISSARALPSHVRVDEWRYAPSPDVRYGFVRRSGERLHEVPVLSARAVMGPPEQRCWVERERLVVERGDPNVGGALAGALIGGVIGHQIGAGHGRDLATGVGVVTGAAIGANVNRDDHVTTRPVERCRNVPGSRPAYWDVTYQFRGEQHQVQMTEPPGQTLTVNGRGEPRGG